MGTVTPVKPRLPSRLGKVLRKGPGSWLPKVAFCRVFEDPVGPAPSCSVCIAPQDSGLAYLPGLFPPVIDGLDLLKKEHPGARDGIRYLEAEFKKGNRWVRTTGPVLSPRPTPRPVGPALSPRPTPG